MNTEEFFAQLWREYVAITPQAERVRQLFSSRNNTVRNDHVAFRTFNLAPVSLSDLEAVFFSLGYERHQNYQFSEKKLSAWGYVHPEPANPLIFLSELLTEQLSEQAQNIIANLCAQVPGNKAADPTIFMAGRLWETPSWNDYQTLLRESEYAAWLAMLGYRANHFTVSVHDLDVDNSIEKVTALVEENGFPLNRSGGVIKGKASDLLVQASTLADKMKMTFSDGESHEISTCYYEFAYRYADESGELYKGFVAKSADKIFESTDQMT